MGYREENIPERNCKRYFSQGTCGQDLFFIELIDAGFLEYFFSSSLPVKIFEQADLIKLQHIIVNKNLSESTRKHFIGKLFNVIKMLPNIKKYYFEKYVLDKFGKYSEVLEYTYETIIFSHKPEILVAYSPYCNEGVFHEMKKAFISDKDDNTSVPAEKELFEENLVNDNLRFAYVEVYSNEAKYYFQQEKTENTMLEFYYMTVHDELVFLFLISPF